MNDLLLSPNTGRTAGNVSDASCLRLPQDQRKHRFRLAARTRAILGQFWRDEAIPDEVQVFELEGWVDVLEPLTEAEVRAAWATYQVGGPRTAGGKLYRPDPGAIVLIATALRRGVDPSDPVMVCKTAFYPEAKQAAAEREAKMERWRRIRASHHTDPEGEVSVS